MHNKYILYLSTNTIWGGSEVLWSQSARQFIKKGYRVKAGLRYSFGIVKNFLEKQENFLDLSLKAQQPPILFRILKKLRLITFSAKNLLLDDFKKNKPDLVIISQGNNIEGASLMRDCTLHNIPFITITQLVTLDFWPALQDEQINEIRELYNHAKCNYFVSQKTLLLHEQMIGAPLSNSALIYNPFIKIIPQDIKYPLNKNGFYKVALIGRMETFHKGYDLLIDVIKNEKWKNRPIHFSFFGNGPHVGLLKRLISKNGIVNVSFHSHEDNLGEIWKEHQMLIMPSRMEGQSLSLIEAMRFSRAAIVTDVGGTSELIEDGLNGFIAPYPIAEFIDAAMERAWNKRDEWEQLGLNAEKSIMIKHPADALAYFNDKVEAML